MDIYSGYDISVPKAKTNSGLFTNTLPAMGKLRHLAYLQYLDAEHVASNTIFKHGGTEENREYKRKKQVELLNSTNIGFFNLCNLWLKNTYHTNCNTCLISGCRLCATGQVLAVFSSMVLSLSV